MPSSSPYTAKFAARYRSAKSAAAADAEVSLERDGVVIKPHGISTPIVWPFRSLRTGEAIRPRSIEVLLSSAGVPNATLFVPSREFAEALLLKAPQLSRRAERWSRAKPWLAFTSAVIALGVFIHLAGFSPVRAIASTLPLSWRERLGNETIRSMTSGKKFCVDARGTAALDRLSARLSSGISSTTPFKIVVVDWSLVNAFAVPGQQIVLTEALIEDAKSPDELAAVLAHEMGHGIRLHTETAILRAVGLATAIELMIGGGGGTLANLGLALAQIGYTRSAEREADEQALLLLKAAKISPRGVSDFFDRITEKEKQKTDGGRPDRLQSAFDMLRTHPPSGERAEMARRQAAYDATPALSATDWSQLRQICAEKTDKRPET